MKKVQQKKAVKLLNIINEQNKTDGPKHEEPNEEPKEEPKEEPTEELLKQPMKQPITHLTEDQLKIRSERKKERIKN